MLLAEVLVAITAVAQAKHRHHEEERDQAERREDSTVMAYCTAPLGFSPIPTEDFKVVFIGTALEKYFISFTSIKAFICEG